LSITPNASHSECLIPLAKAQRPLTRYPPSTAIASPVGDATPAALGALPPTKISSMASSDKKAAMPDKVPAPIIKHQPADGSIRLAASITSNWIMASASAPPNTLAVLKENNPDS
jgi:hypothetical protein